MASEKAWYFVREYFSPDEFDDPNFPGSGREIDEDLLYKLFRLRDFTGWPIIIHKWSGGAVDVEGKWGHAANSYHLLKNGAKAVDFHFSTNAPVNVQIQEVLKIGFGGVGLYFDWEYKGKPLPIGFHVDTRPSRHFVIWKRINKRYIYVIP